MENGQLTEVVPLEKRPPGELTASETPFARVADKQETVLDGQGPATQTTGKPPPVVVEQVLPGTASRGRERMAPRPNSFVRCAGSAISLTFWLTVRPTGRVGW